MKEAQYEKSVFLPFFRAQQLHTAAWSGGKLNRLKPDDPVRVLTVAAA
jgi:hypothetical protein